jgi:double-stranded uracil-DNA glycosylase
VHACFCTAQFGKVTAMRLPNAPPHSSDSPILPDVLRPGLRLIFCGTAAGKRSAQEGAYYAHPGNMFWRALFQAGLTPRLLTPQEFPLLPGFGIGLTDLAKRHVGNDDELPRDAFDVPGLLAKVETYAPTMLAFTSKHAARAVLGAGVGYGLQHRAFGSTKVFVLPSPSGQARGHWDVAHWLALAARAGCHESHHSS